MESSEDEAEGKRARENSSSGCVPWWARIFMRLALSRVLSADRWRAKEGLSCVACSRVLGVIGVEWSCAKEPVILLRD